MKFNSETVKRWSGMVEAYLKEKSLTVEDIRLGADAWAAARRAGCLENAYGDRTVTDAHIVTALKRIFPKATFRDKYIY